MKVFSCQLSGRKYRSQEKVELCLTPFANDTFLVAGLALGEVESHFHYQIRYEDIDIVNRLANEGKLEVGKVSLSLFCRVLSEYILLPVGACLTQSHGPIVLSRKPIDQGVFSRCSLGIPGRETTAYNLFSAFFGQASCETILANEEIPSNVQEQKIDLGLVIHNSKLMEKRFGLYCAADLYSLWVKKNQCPLPLGGIVVNRNKGKAFAASVWNDLSQSLEFAQGVGWNRAIDYARRMSSNPQGSSESMIASIRSFVTEDTKDLSSAGVKAIESLFSLLNKDNCLSQEGDKSWLFTP